MVNNRGNITRSITMLSVLPLLILGIVLTLVTSNLIYRALCEEVEYSLGTLVHSSYSLYEIAYPGDYEIIGDEIFKGGKSLKNEFSFVDNIKEISAADATLFFGDKRYITTIRTKDGLRAVGTKAEQKVSDAVLVNGEDFFSNNVLVNGTSYFGYYMPLKDSGGKIIGMLFAGKPHSQVMQKINNNIFLITISVLLILACSIILSNYYSRKIIISLKETKIFLGEIAGGNLNAGLDSSLLARNDEIGEMSRFAVMLQNSIVDLVGKDPLTGLYNRRSGNITIENLWWQYQRKGIEFSIAMGDVDLFKSINDTYGHSTGDEVLKRISDNLNKHMAANGFVFRWGGEEFLLLYEGLNKDEVSQKIIELKSSIKEPIISPEGESILVTLTFGIASCTEVDSIPKFFDLADERLYKGKGMGRDCIITETDTI